MTVFSVVGVCLVGALTVIFIKELKRELVPMILLGLGIIVILGCLPWISETVGFMRELTEYAESEYTGTVLKALGIAYLTAIGAELCRSCGEQSVVTYVETAGKIGILALAVPIFRELFEMALLK